MKKPTALASLQICGSIAALLAFCSPAAAQQLQVDLKLVLAVDVSPVSITKSFASSVTAPPRPLQIPM
jgi:hypothetical protein